MQPWASEWGGGRQRNGGLLTQSGSLQSSLYGKKSVCVRVCLCLWTGVMRRGRQEDADWEHHTPPRSCSGFSTAPPLPHPHRQAPIQGTESSEPRSPGAGIGKQREWSQALDAGDENENASRLHPPRCTTPCISSSLLPTLSQLTSQQPRKVAGARTHRSGRFSKDRGQTSHSSGAIQLSRKGK